MHTNNVSTLKFTPRAFSLVAATVLGAGVLLAGPALQAAITPEGNTNPVPGNAYWSGGGDTSTSIYIGDTADGSLSITDGSTFTSHYASIGQDNGVNGEVTVSGATWNSQMIVVGAHGVGTLNLTNGAKVTTNNYMIITGYVDGDGTLNMGVSSHDTMVEAAQDFKNYGTVQLFALGNITAGVYVPVTAGDELQSGTTKTWGGMADANLNFTVSDFTTYTSPLTADLSNMRVSAGGGELVVAFADDAGNGTLTLEQVIVPPSSYDYYEAVDVILDGMSNDDVVLSFYMGEGYDEETIQAWILVDEQWEEIDMDETLSTYEEEYLNFMVDGSGTYAVTGNLVPEPGHYAALAGLLALTGIAIRRRRARD